MKIRKSLIYIFLTGLILSRPIIAQEESIYDKIDKLERYIFLKGKISTLFEGSLSLSKPYSGQKYYKSIVNSSDRPHPEYIRDIKNKAHNAKLLAELIESADISENKEINLLLDSAGVALLAPLTHRDKSNHEWFRKADSYKRMYNIATKNLDNVIKYVDIKIVEYKNRIHASNIKSQVNGASCKKLFSKF